jgi:hypothetical protein
MFEKAILIISSEQFFFLIVDAYERSLMLKSLLFVFILIKVYLSVSNELHGE